MGIKGFNTSGSGKDFENDIAATFQGYADKHVARLAIMPVPTKQVGVRNGMPTLIRNGKAPFDVYGFLSHDATMIGAELKASKRKARLPIVAPQKKGDGVQFHQLDALATLALAGGIARIVWSNGGEIGVLHNSEIIQAWRTYEHALTSELSNRTVPKGAKSIQWEMFKPVQFNLLTSTKTVGPDWLQM